MDKNLPDLAGLRSRVRLSAVSDAPLPVIGSRASGARIMVSGHRVRERRDAQLPRSAAHGLPGLLPPSLGRAAEPAQEEGHGFDAWEDSQRLVRSRRTDDNEAREADLVQTLLPSMIDGFILSAGVGISSAAARVVEGWRTKMSGAHFSCLTCGVQCKAVKSTATVLLVDIIGHANVEWPNVQCPPCGGISPASPASLSVFPGSPNRPEVVYTFDLLRFTKHVYLGGPTSMNHWTSSLHAFHRESGCFDGNYHATWQNLGWAFDSWLRLEDGVELQLREKGMPKPPRCAACAARGTLHMDACFGLSRFRAAAKSSGFRIESNRADDLFVPQDMLMTCLRQSKAISCRSNKCAKFAASYGTPLLASKHKDFTALFGACCGCGQVLAMTPVMTPGEAYGHPHAILKYVLSPAGGGMVVGQPGAPVPDVRNVLDGKESPILQAVCYDIACRFLSHWVACV